MHTTMKRCLYLKRIRVLFQSVNFFISVLFSTDCYEAEKLEAVGTMRVFVVYSTRGHCGVSMTSDWTLQRRVLTLIRKHQALL